MRRTGGKHGVTTLPQALFLRRLLCVNIDLNINVIGERCELVTIKMSDNSFAARSPQHHLAHYSFLQR